MIGDLPFYYLKISLAIENKDELMDIVRAKIKSGRAK
jgi:tetraacyldisaccharide 4'-kinase